MKIFIQTFIYFNLQSFFYWFFSHISTLIIQILISFLIYFFIIFYLIFLMNWRNLIRLNLIILITTNKKHRTISNHLFSNSLPIWRLKIIGRFISTTWKICELKSRGIINPSTRILCHKSILISSICLQNTLVIIQPRPSSLFLLNLQLYKFLFETKR